MVKTKKKFVCEDCGKELKNARALVGHTWFAHGRRIGEKTSLYDNIKTLEREKGTNPDTIERIENIDETLEEFTEKMTAVDEGIAELKELGIKRDEVILKVLGLLQEKPANPGNPVQVKEKTDEKKKKKSLVHTLLYDD